MSLRFEKNLIQFLIVFVTIANICGENVPALGDLVPKIQQEHYELIPEANQYHLRINLPDGSSRNEFVELKSPGTPDEELLVKGTITNLFANGATDIVVYEAGKNGYVVKYKYQGQEMHVPLSISANALKSAVG